MLDPYGSTRTGLYVFFEDGSAGELDALVRAASTADFGRTIANHATGTGFEGTWCIGLVPRRPQHADPHLAPRGQRRGRR